MMTYQSTRGIQNLSFEQTTLHGLAEDGGLIVPSTLPDMSRLLDQKNLTFQNIAFEIFSKFVKEEIPTDELQNMIDASYVTFRSKQITPIKTFHDLSILELFHGPSFSFKDVALQFLGNIFEYFLTRRGNQINILGATSGDTGSAAIAGMKGKTSAQLFILYPKGGTSKIQELQMTTVLDHNIHAISVDGTFDDAQSLVKTLFRDLDFKKRFQLSAVNSINWSRIMAQTVYYFHVCSQLKLKTGDDPIHIIVPTGNFGNILAGFYAQQMGVPIQLVAACNQNDSLHQFFQTGTYARQIVKPSISPAMDIQAPSNFERFVYELTNRDATQTQEWLQTFEKEGRLTFPQSLFENAKKKMQTFCISEEETLATIKEFYQKFQYEIDPHTAVGLCASKRLKGKSVCLATAHPAKFPDTMKQALACPPQSCKELQQLTNLQTRSYHISSSESELKALMEKLSCYHLKSGAS